jgi:mannose-1-phosphate guanylyltransferase
MQQAFVLGAGLGTRLRPLTWQRPKPLIPVHHRPLAEWAFAHLQLAGVREFVVNTHHLPAEWGRCFPDSSWAGCPIQFRHEPVLLETGGGLANVQDLLGGGTSIMYNGDVWTDLPLAPALEQHRAQGNLVTLVLRSNGAVRNVALDVSTRRVLDLRNALGTNHPDQFQFTGICVMEPEFFRYLPERGIIESVVASWLRAIAAGERIGGSVVDEGLWLDLGDRSSYLEAHRLIPSVERIHPSAQIAGEVDIDDFSSVGPECVIGAGTRLQNSVLWPGAKTAAGAHLDRCIVLTGATAAGRLIGDDVEADRDSGDS